MKHHRKVDPDADAADSDSESSLSRRRHNKKSTKHKKSHKRKHKHRKKDRRSRHKDGYDSDSSHIKRDRKRRRNSHGDDNRSRKSRSRGSDKQTASDAVELTTNEIFVQALCSLLEERPVFCGELPIMLIRMVGGATFNLRQMTDVVAANGLERVFESLAVYGVQKQKTNDQWLFSPPAGASRRDELVLLKVVRSILDEFGVDVPAIQHHEKELASIEQSEKADEQSKKDEGEKFETIRLSTTKLLNDFQDADANLGKQLAEISKTILRGESLCIDGLPHEHLKNTLRSIFEECGLEKSEMENSDDDSVAEAEVSMGYSLPENDKDVESKLKLIAFIETCQAPGQKRTRRVLGPQRPPANLSEDDDEGPAPFGATSRDPALASARMQQQAELQTSEGQREEWMLVPGKHDFLSSLKAGQSIKSRGFKNEKAPHPDVQEEINPEIQKEMDNIMECHKAARGPSLFTQHRARKQQEKDQASEEGAEWKWSRDNDLDAGRRVDKDALKMMLGGAGNNLQSKFHGGFNR